jgi:uncharacterized protein
MARHDLVKTKLRFSLIEGRFAVSRLAADAQIPEWALRRREFLSITRTSDELSVVCREELAPPDVKAERGWLCLKLHGPFPFFETGILTGFVNPLSNAGIPIFAISTFDTDYVLIKEDAWERARMVLGDAGHQLVHVKT